MTERQSFEVEGCSFCEQPAIGRAIVNAKYGLGAGVSRNIGYCAEHYGWLFTEVGIKPEQNNRFRFLHEFSSREVVLPAVEHSPRQGARKDAKLNGKEQAKADHPAGKGDGWRDAGTMPRHDDQVPDEERWGPKVS